jgi:hypothetical protein
LAITYSPKIVTDGLVLCLDAANPKSYPGSGTTWFDISGQGKNGILTNGPTYTSGINGYFNFDATDDYVEVNITSSPMQTTHPITLEIWMYRVGGGMLVSAGGYYGLFAAGTFWYWNNNPNWVYYNCPVSVPSNTWCHYCLTFNGSNNPVFYINSQSYTSTGTFAAPSPFGSSILRIGEYTVYRPYSPFGGRVAQTRFYNRVLSAQEIQQNFNATRGRYGI